MKLFHRNNASFIFVLLYLHLYKNMAVYGYRLVGVWSVGLLIMLCIMGAAFTGYVLVASQIRFWAAMVITRLLGVIPLLGEVLLYTVWGGYSISWVTYQTFLVLHFSLPFVVIGLLVVHLAMLHKRGRRDPLGIHSGALKVPFYPYYWVKDILNIFVYLVAFFLIIVWPYALGEVELY